LRLNDLLKALPEYEVVAQGYSPDPEINGISYDSRAVSPDYLFVAVSGFHTDGHKYIPDAIENGARAVIGTNRKALLNLAAAPPNNKVAFVQVKDERAALAHLSACFYNYPARKLGVIGVTGTDGKTTTTFLIASLLDTAGLSSGLMGTVDFKIGARRWSNDTRQTTPEAREVQELLDAMVQQNVRYAVLESTSHALALNKLLDCYYDIAVLTNITHEHLDYHGTFENYREAKGRLFEYLRHGYPKPFLKHPPTAIVNADDPNAGYFLERAGPDVRIIRYGQRNPADIFPSEINATAARLEYNLHTPLGKTRISLKLPGDFNVYNSMAAAAVGMAVGLNLEQIKTGLESVTGVPGRMEAIEEGQPFSVVVDYAHTPESLTKVLNILRPLTPGRLLVVFGSAGERDRTKRPMQGAVAARLADFAVFTNEDPRLEDENAIIREIAEGAEQLGWRPGRDFLEIADRRTALETAFREARPGDTVLLAGKGHEQCIIIGKEKIPWDESREAREALRRLGFVK
jgi:UDP-N-acetylmuramoyl-L-alanyl-D-glutamate--2,6-diaminopimelate ligase